MRGKIRYSKTFSEFTVTPEKIVPAKGAEIPASRLNSIDIKNRFDPGFQVAASGGSSGGYIIGGAAGAGMAVAGGINTINAASRQAAHQQMAKAGYFVVAEAGGREVKLAEKMTEAGARGLQADIIRVLQGQSL